jgi:2-oxo-4-hydroxy-4-carboxy-5-ureidoimidazoline decarboxylase
MPESAQARISIAELNAMDRDDFTRALGGVLEHSPHLAERAWAARPFASLDSVEKAFATVMSSASAEEKLALLRAHPDLASRLVSLTKASSREQAAAQLDTLPEAELTEFQKLNTQYREKFGFPFIICARLNSRETILTAFRTRLGHSRDAEFTTALAEVAKIARLRLADLLTE